MLTPQVESEHSANALTRLQILQSPLILMKSSSLVWNGWVGFPLTLGFCQGIESMLFSIAHIDSSGVLEGGAVCGHGR